MHQGRLVTTLGTVLLLDVLRVFLPSLITLFGQAGATGPALMGAFALVWFLAPFPFVYLARWVPPLALALSAGGLLAVGRVALQATEGGGPQLYLASSLVGLGVVGLVCTVMATVTDGRVSALGVMTGVVAGVAASAALHTVLGTVDPLWREGALVWVGVSLLAVTYLGTAARAWRATSVPPMPTPPRSWLALGPLLFLSGLYTANPAVAETIGGTPYAASALAVVAVASIAVAAHPRWVSPNPYVPLAVLLAVLATLAFAARLPGDVPGALPAWTLIALLLGQLALAACAGWAATDTVTAASPTRTGVLATLGLLGFVVLVFAFYAAYDLHVTNTYVPFAALLLLAVAVLPRMGDAVPPPPEHVLPATAVAAALTLVVTIAAPLARPEADAPRPSADGLRVAAYNVRMGFGMDGRFSVAEQADTLRELDADVIALSEVDRGWLLNGGHDGLSLLAEHLDMTAYWAPADGPFWGDAVLTNLPVSSVRGHALPGSGPTGAQALEVTVAHDGTEVTVVSTHLQPEGYDLGNPTARAQLDALFDIAATAHERGTPVVVAGDLNFEPEELSLGEVLHDAFADVRPFPTMAADTRSDQQIDHILTTEELTASDPANPDVPHSDHRPIAVTLTH
ncbi:endonuclease/exonuclease/phosphatase family protein [Nocardiopsis sp. JB363]|uniref:endonuclease/exonuclease/phosphatase family protein n=1 Tax=Nocardiopsis sp. JB363 TaxID=1434837 RepID=UPI00097B338F|nr:endonuclease/exonuclease/phosphatase family protein [Nocardiopsis sp. JB363]SIO85798.1 Probable secreted protein [Nocardiopsis sp. JB363]